MPGRTTSDGCGTNVISTLGTPRSAGAARRRAPMIAGVAAVHAVEHADRDDAAAPAGRDRVQAMPALHPGEPTDAPPDVEWRLCRSVVRYIARLSGERTTHRKVGAVRRG